jgi:heme/copper-type cytochrome/quinol oxidase subunit 4
MLGGVAAAIPFRWMLLIIAPIAALYAVVLLFRGLPVFMHLKHSDGTRFLGACIVAAGFITILTTGFMYMELCWNPLTGAEYVESVAEPELN